MSMHELLDEMHAEFPKFKLVPKDESKLMRFLAVLLKPISPDFMKHFATTLGKTVYYPRDWSDWTMYEVLRHERVHMRDSKKWGLLYYLTYALLPLPLVFSGRAYWEFRGYCESLKVGWETMGRPLYGGKPVIAARDMEWVVEQFTGPSYLWMFPFGGKLRAAFRKASLGWL